jgi:beta-phosphoglucomutase-like phosphatase (HAD superfamily)
LSQNIRQLLQGKRLLIVDFDGAVADTSPLHAAALEQVLSPLGIAVHYPSIASMKTKDAMVYSAQN